MRSAVVEQVRQPVAAAAHDSISNLSSPSLGERAELDLPGLEMAGERDEPKRRRRHLDHADRPVPRPGHADDELVADAQRAVDRRGPFESGRTRSGRRGSGRRSSRSIELSRRQPRGADARRCSGDGRAGPTPSSGRWKLVARDAGGTGGGSSCGGAVRLAPVHRRRAPHVVPRRQRDAERPGAARSERWEGRAAWHRSVRYLPGARINARG